LRGQGGSTGTGQGGGSGDEKLENKRGKVAKHKQGGLQVKGKEETVRKSSWKETCRVRSVEMFFDCKTFGSANRS
jgi:hypothetical protein